MKGGSGEAAVGPVLRAATIGPRLRLIERFGEFTGQYPSAASFNAARYAWSWTPSGIATVVAQSEDPFEVMRGDVFFGLLKRV